MPIVLDGTAGITYPAGSVGTVAAPGDTQTWQNVTGSRSFATTYTNSTGKPIMVAVDAVASTAGAYGNATVSGVYVCSIGQGYAATVGLNSVTFLVPTGGTYIINTTVGTLTKSVWSELR